MSRSLARPQAALILITLLWSSTFAVAKDLLQQSPPLLYLSIRFLLGATLMVIFLGQDRRLSFGLFRGLGKDALVLGSLQALGLVLQVLGQPYTTASKSAFLTALSVPLTPVFAGLFRGDRPGRAQIAAVGCGALGLLLLTYPRDGVSWNRGDLLTLCCAVVYALAIVETAHRARPQQARRLATAQIVVCAGLFVVAYALLHLLPAGCAGELSRQEARPLHFSGKLLAQWIYLGVFCTAVTFSVQTWAMARMNATQAAVIFALEPVFATALSLLVLGAAEWPGWRGALGAALVLLAVLGGELPSRWGRSPAAG